MSLASRGLRDMGEGTGPIGDSSELAIVRAQARKVLFKSAAATAAVMLGVVVLWRALA
jgi:hypothetical protein